LGVFCFCCVFTHMASEERIWHLIARALAAELSAAELAEMESIFINEPERRVDFENLKKLTLDASAVTSIDERRALERGLNKFDRFVQESGFTERTLFNQSLEPLPQSRFKSWMIAASLVPFFVIGAWVMHFSRAVKVAQAQSLTAGYGKRVRSTLPDGSVVWLNSGSVITYNNSKSGKREINLTGEAYFDVKHDTEHPFIVHAGKLNIVVLGTAFNVKAYQADAYIETTLLRGKVEILNDARPGSIIVLKPNEKVAINKLRNNVKRLVVSNQPVADSVANLQNEDVVKNPVPDNEIIETAWVSNYLTFKREAFDDLAGRLERWYNVNIIFDNNKYADRQFTGRFKDQDITEVMDALQLTGSFHYRINNNQIHIW
jgi:transmembrane sensor